MTSKKYMDALVVPTLLKAMAAVNKQVREIHRDSQKEIEDLCRLKADKTKVLPEVNLGQGDTDSLDFS